MAIANRGGFNLRSLEKDVAAGPSCGRVPSVSIPKMSSWPVPHKDQGFFFRSSSPTRYGVWPGCSMDPFCPVANHQAPPSQRLHQETWFRDSRCSRFFRPRMSPKTAAAFFGGSAKIHASASKKFRAKKTLKSFMFVKVTLETIHAYLKPKPTTKNGKIGPLVQHCFL